MAFPHKPKDIDGLITMLGIKADATICLYGDIEYPVKQLAERVFNDLKVTKKAKLKEVISEFSSRYYYDCSGNSYSMSGKRMVSNRGWGSMDKKANFFGVDRKLLKELADASKKEAKEEREEREEEQALIDDIIASFGVEIVKDPAIDPIKYSIYVKAREDFYNNHNDHPRYKAFRRDKSKKRQAFWETSRILSEKVATVDAKAFMGVYNDHHIVKLDYGDDNGQMEGVIEHGGLFDKITCICISHH